MSDTDHKIIDDGDSAQVWLESAEPMMERVPIASLLSGISPRSGEIQEHARMLAECEGTLAPIIVHRPSMRVIDGMHRLRAGMLRGEVDIDVRWYDGDDRSAFVLAVRANTTHGLPLSRAERTAAATRILDGRPDWSDRIIAAIAGLSPKTIESIRARTEGPRDPEQSRLGRDGRVRPLNAASARRLAGDLIAERPGASLREIAKKVGLAPSTVLDVRERVLAGRSPVPDRQKDAEARVTAGTSLARGDDQAATVKGATPRRSHQRARRASDRAAQLQLLRKDPSIRFNDMGRSLLRSLDPDIASPEKRARVLEAVPVHCVDTVTDLARDTAMAWQDLADQLSARQQVVLSTASSDE